MRKIVKMSYLILILISTTFISGCASIVSGTTENVDIRTMPEGAKCRLENPKGSWMSKKTPENVKIHTAYDDLQVTCTKPGYKKTTKQFKSQTKGIVFGNVIFGGIIGGGIDLADGAAFYYPKTMIVELDKTQNKS
ncbi:MAG: hypothetical protein ACE365_02740 [Gammaproteobacteria bacterium]